ncbi:hypothetical protein EVAR_82804_1 [Eumeta japonica]|uniref:Uncharacterized protein n=1 Tax=Eumeta variegata TaxID=151549 RepID=A0A4C1UMW4_EUMVA|nr:hypothetical protein EVAR_82804_1 [Eumeta japonica]
MDSRLIDTHTHSRAHRDRPHPPFRRPTQFHKGARRRAITSTAYACWRPQNIQRLTISRHIETRVGSVPPEMKPGFIPARVPAARCRRPANER